MSTSTTKQKRIFVFDSPRTCSLLFAKLFEAHPQLKQIWFPYAAAFAFGPDRVDTQLQKNDKAEEALASFVKRTDSGGESFERAWERLSETVQRAEQHVRQ